jgi:biotin carboxyl carrier protein
MTPGPAPKLVPKQPGDGSADPRAIRVHPAGRAAASFLPPLVIGPADPGTAPGGQGAALVDGTVIGARLERLDDVRAVLVTPGSSRNGQDGSAAERQRLLLMPEAPRGEGPDGVTRREVVVEGWSIDLEIEPAARAALRERARRGRAEAGQSGPTELRAIIPGVVVSISVAPGDLVSAGQQLLVIEAMKMQNELRAPRDGTIERVEVDPGETIEVGDLLLVVA